MLTISNVQVQADIHNYRAWLVNPFLFMTAQLVEPEADATGSYNPIGNEILGQNVSSLHRLKDIDNKGGSTTAS